MGPEIPWILSKMYDPQADSWQQTASMPGRQHKHAAAAMGGKIYVSGGDGDGESTVSTLVISIRRPTRGLSWQAWVWRGQIMPPQRLAARSMFFGGYCAGVGRIASVEAYDPISNEWAFVSGLTEAREEFVAVAV